MERGLRSYCCDGGVAGFCVAGAGFAGSTGAGAGVVVAGAGEAAGAGVVLAGVVAVAPGAGVVAPGAGVVVALGFVAGFAGAAGRGGAFTPLTTELVPR